MASACAISKSRLSRHARIRLSHAFLLKHGRMGHSESNTSTIGAHEEVLEISRPHLRQMAVNVMGGLCARKETGGRLGRKQLPVPLGDYLDGAVNYFDGGLIINRVRRRWPLGGPFFCVGHGILRESGVIQMRKQRKINQS